MMNMNMKASKKMRDFMCHSPGATAVVCMSTADHRSVMVPRRPERAVVDHHHYTRLMKKANYIRLGGRNNIAPAASASNVIIRSTDIIPSLKRNNRADYHNKQIQKIPPQVLSSSDQVFQVVVMRVSLHCQGCVGKLKKHLSKMEGVTSFSIDLESKRVTVMGHVSPVMVLESISKVKRAEFWPKAN